MSAPTATGADEVHRVTIRMVERTLSCALCGTYPHAQACPDAPPAMEWPPRLDRALKVTRAMLALAIFAGALIWYRQAPLPMWLAVPLAVLLAGLIVSVLLLVEAAPAKGPGRIVSDGCCGHEGPR